MCRRFLAFLFIGGLLLAACARGASTAMPPDIRYGEDLCTECNMIISDPRYAAGYAFEIAPGRYESLAFDDIGDLLAHMEKHPERQIVAWYVHDYTTEEWLDATAAYYVVSDQIISPMGHGIAAHATQAAAEAMDQAKAGHVLDWNGLLAQAKASAGHHAHID
ncbi:MAG: nitrous oxide reductase accessory protein NosL [Caldilineaceae bacterium]